MTTIARMLALVVLGMILAAPAARAAGLDPTAVQFTAPSDIKWVRNAAGTNETAMLFGDPAKPGLYVYRIRWLAVNMSRPHFHPNDRYITVISGTWWVGTGATYDPDSTVALPAGTFVTHFGKQIHYDGAKDDEVVLEIVGEGPATSTPAEAK